MRSPKRSTREHLTLTPSLDTITIETIIAQHLTNTFANYEATKNNNPQHNGIGIIIHGSNNVVLGVCTNEEYLNYKPRSFYGNGVYG